ncbi:hypothetical protein HanXRQr2_Chr17g0791541 [Helianthus annuus]|uniref:Uncharacterized protein n=1 Tax=Helianthus annuus TaxID=4232 RepID=A0A9K3GTP9_HELAN|nr:hypothetical protein HanXRQr2_Chr17g0791541 [Helianthus annuus]KAJ0812217.1 hypothetical protein HanPSC8_Chr17g0759481 [Helianthus annuus]
MAASMVASVLSFRIWVDNWLESSPFRNKYPCSRLKQSRIVWCMIGIASHDNK